MLVYIDNKSGDQAMNQDGEEDCFVAQHVRVTLSLSTYLGGLNP